MRNNTILIVASVFAISLMASQVMAADQAVTLMLGGKFCDSYLDDVEGALKKVAGVKGVDLKSMPGHAVVTHDESMKPEALVAAMKGVKGTKMGVEWFCTAEVMK